MCSLTCPRTTLPPLAAPPLPPPPQFIGFMIGSSYGAWTSVVSHAAEYLQKSRWSPRLICPPIAQFKPCIDDYACRSMMEKDR